MDLNVTYAVDKRSGQTDTVASTLSFTGNNTHTGAEQFVNVYASGITASGIISASGISAAGNISASGNIYASGISASGISASNITASGSISASNITATESIYGSITNSTTYSGLVTCDYSLTNTYVVGPITGATTVYIKNATPGQMLYLVIIQDGTGHAVTFQVDPPFYLQLGSAGTPSAAAGETTTYSFVVIRIGTNTFINAASKVTSP